MAKRNSKTILREIPKDSRVTAARYPDGIIRQGLPLRNNRSSNPVGKPVLGRYQSSSSQPILNARSMISGLPVTGGFIPASQSPAMR